MIFNFWILAIAFSVPMSCPDRRIDVIEQRCAAESPELFFYISKDKAIADYSVMPSSADRARLYKVEMSWPKNRFSSDWKIDVFSIDLIPVKSYEVKISTRQIISWKD